MNRTKPNQMRTFKKDLIDFTYDLANEPSDLTLNWKKDPRAVREIDRIIKLSKGSTGNLNSNNKNEIYSNLISVHEYQRVLDLLSDMACQMQKEREEYNSLVDDIKSTGRYLKKK